MVHRLGGGSIRCLRDRLRSRNTWLLISSESFTPASTAGDAPGGVFGVPRFHTGPDARVVVVHVFTKKTQKTPRREIEMALKRAKEVR